jgi:hypothetical protein
MTSPQVGSMQNYFGYIVQSMYHLNLNQQVFQHYVSNEFANINNEIFTIKWTITHMEDWQHNLQTNWVNKYGGWIDNTGDMDDFDLEPNNVDIEMTFQPGEWYDNVKKEEEDDTDDVQEQEGDPTNPSDQARQNRFLCSL